MFANSERQEIDLVAGNDVYVLKLTTAAAIGLEKKLKKSIGQILSEMSNFNVTMMADVAHWLLQERHGDEFPNTEAGHKKVMSLMDRCKSKVLIQAMMDAFGLKEEEAADGPNPQEAQAGTGEPSTLKLAESA